MQLLLREPGHSSAPFVLAPRSIAPMDYALRSTLDGYRRRRPRSGPMLEPDGLNHSVRQPQSLPLQQRAVLALTTLNDLGPVRVTPSLREVASFKPQVIHSLLGGVRAMRVVLSMARKLELPVVPHFMDDWVNNLYANGQLSGLAPRESSAYLRGS